MGKTEMKKKKRKRGRPSLSDLHNSSGRSTRRNPNYSDSDSDERIQKKLKLVQRLPNSNSPSLSNSPDIEPSANRSVIKAEKVIELQQGSPLESGPTAPLPDKKLLVFILDRLQKKDTYGVYSEPVDIDELTDYLEIIERPMDFGTVRKKLDEQSYANLDDFESDVLLICANGMQYNAPDTVYYRQAKSIQEIAKRDFQNLRQVNDEGVPQPKVVRRGRPPNLKKALTSPPERVGPESSSDATLANAGDNNNNIDDHKSNIANDTVGSNAYNLRKGIAASLKFQSSDALFRASPQSRNNETYADYTTDWNSEFPASILKAEAKHTKKTFTTDESRRTTYKQFHPNDSSSLNTINGNAKHLIGMGLHSEHGYARSLARFAANLGPVVWKIASKKIGSILPSGVNFGPGWVGENDAISSQPQPSVLPTKTLLLSNSSHVQAGPSQMPFNEQSILRNSVSTTGSGQVRNGFNNLSGIDFQTQAEILRARLNLPTGQQSGAQEAHLSTPNHSTPEPIMGVSSSKGPQNLAYNNIIPVPPDLNVRFQAPGSPFQPDLALQL